ncbi:hypothetical protein EYF80_016133 [Liparis tanakae]|uniref:Uncharacterized protein n=1 Tax=Liparis tanakae TaxID=230148 RepID=A0A4Z2I6H2_9TELE|nr:hypothetical protein EYF80_016133 [Liparis tanakae]
MMGAAETLLAASEDGGKSEAALVSRMLVMHHDKSVWSKLQSVEDEPPPADTSPPSLQGVHNLFNPLQPLSSHSRTQKSIYKFNLKCYQGDDGVAGERSFDLRGKRVDGETLLLANVAADGRQLSPWGGGGTINHSLASSGDVNC